MPPYSEPESALPYPVPFGGGQVLAPPTGLALPSFPPHLQFDEAPIDLRRYLGILLRRKWLLIFSVLLGLIIGLTHTISQVPIYRAAAVVEARPPVINPYGYTDFTADQSKENFKGDQIQLLKSAALAQRVAQDYQVDMPQAAITSENAPPGFFAELQAQLTAWLMASPGAEPDDRLSAPAPVDGAETANQAAIEAAVQQHLAVEPVPQTNLLRVAIDDESPRRAAALANAVAKTYVTMNMERRSQGSNKAQDFYDSQVRKTRAELEDLERRLISYAKGKDLVSLENLLEHHEKEFTELKSMLFEAEQRLFQAESKFTAMRDAGGSGGEEFLKNEVIQGLKTRRAQLEDEYQLNLEVYLPEYPKMEQLSSQIKAIDRQIKEESRSIAKSIEIAFETAKREKASLEERVKEGREQLLAIRDQTADYNALQREHAALQAVYDGLMKRIKEAGIVADVQGNNVAILDIATPPALPYKPNLQKNLLVSLALGVILGVGLILLLEKLDDTLKSTDEAERLMGVPMLGAIPFISPDNRRQEDLATNSGALSDPKSPLAEAARSLRTTLFFAAAGGAPKVIHFTSSAPAEGKSVANFTTALAFARGGATVLCIDADLRNPSLHRLFDVPNNQGLSNYLVSTLRPAEITLATEHEGLFVITSGPLPPNPVELLASQRMMELVRLAAERFDFVFIDGPPVLGLADAPLLSTIAGTTIFVVEPGHTRKAALLDSMKRLRSSQGRVLGSIFQKMGRGGSGYGYGYGYGYKYNYQYLYGYGQGDREQETTS